MASFRPKKILTVWLAIILTSDLFVSGTLGPDLLAGNHRREDGSINTDFWTLMDSTEDCLGTKLTNSDDFKYEFLDGPYEGYSDVLYYNAGYPGDCRRPGVSRSLTELTLPNKFEVSFSFKLMYAKLAGDGAYSDCRASPAIMKFFLEDGEDTENQQEASFCWNYWGNSAAPGYSKMAKGLWYTRKIRVSQEESRIVFTSDDTEWIFSGANLKLSDLQLFGNGWYTEGYRTFPQIREITCDSVPIVEVDTSNQLLLQRYDESGVIRVLVPASNVSECSVLPHRFAYTNEIDELVEMRTKLIDYGADYVMTEIHEEDLPSMDSCTYTESESQRATSCSLTFLRYSLDGSLQDSSEFFFTISAIDVGGRFQTIHLIDWSD